MPELPYDNMIYMCHLPSSLFHSAVLWSEALQMKHLRERMREVENRACRRQSVGGKSSFDSSDQSIKLHVYVSAEMEKAKHFVFAKH